MPNSLRPHGLQPIRLLCPWNSPGKNTGVDRHFLLQGIFLTQRLNLGNLHCRQILYQRSHQGSHTYTYTPSFWISVPLRSPPSTVEFPLLYSRLSLVLYFIHSRSVYMSILISQLIPSPSPPCVHTFFLYVYDSICTLQTGSSVYFF